MILYLSQVSPYVQVSFAGLSVMPSSHQHFLQFHTWTSEEFIYKDKPKLYKQKQKLDQALLVMSDPLHWKL